METTFLAKVAIAISIIALVITSINLFYTHLRKAKIYVKLKGFVSKHPTDLHLLENLKEEYKDHLGCNSYAFLLNIISVNNDFQIKKIEVRIKETNNKDYKWASLYYIPRNDDINFKYPFLNTRSVLEKGKSNDLILQFFIEDKKKQKVEIYNLELIKISFYNFKDKKSTDIILNMNDIDLHNIIPNFIDNTP